MNLLLLLGVRKPYETDGERLLTHILRRYSIHSLHSYCDEYCYMSEPPSRREERLPLVEVARERLQTVWAKEPGPIIGFGWMACEILTGKGKTKLKDMVCTDWPSRLKMENGDQRNAWIIYDPAAALFDPNLAVDISAVLVAAVEKAGGKTEVNKLERAFNWEKYM
jgi:hypothetical protein